MQFSKVVIVLHYIIADYTSLFSQNDFIEIDKKYLNIFNICVHILMNRKIIHN